MSQVFKERSQVKDQQSYISVFVFFLTIIAATKTSPNMTTVFHARLHGRFVEIKSNLRRKKLYRTNQNSVFLEGSFNNRDVITPIQFRR